MKEATGELNMTVITVVAIAAIAALFTIFIMPNIQANIMLQTACSNIDADGNYSASNEGNLTASNTGNKDQENSVTCSNFTCTAIYNGRGYNKQCSGTGNGAGAAAGGGGGGYVVFPAE